MPRESQFDLLDLPIGPSQVRRAQATVLQYHASGIAALSKPELVRLARALSTVVLGAIQGERLAPAVLNWAESICEASGRQSALSR
jgi:hypothetical protein